MRLPDLQLQNRVGHFVTQNASGILTAGGVIGVGATAILTARASFKAAAILREKMAIRQAQLVEENEEAEEYKFAPDFTKSEMIKATWPCYILPVSMGVTTVVCVVMANRMSAKRAAALAAAYSLSETRLQEYKDKITERIGPRKEQNVRDEIAQDRVTNNPPGKEVIILGTGDVLCLDSLTGRYFHSTIERIRQAENQIQKELNQTHYASLSEFYELIGLDPTAFSDNVGWNGLDTGAFELSFSHALTPDNRPCLVVDYANLPKPDYHKLY